MDARECLRQAFESLADHPRRVAASALGVFWGAAALVLMLSWSTGFRDFMKTTFSHYGRGVVFAMPGITSSGYPGQRAGVRLKLDRRDVRIAERESHASVEAILAEHVSEERVLVEATGRVRRLDLVATDERFPGYRNFRVSEGRFFDALDVERARAVAVLGSEAAGELFPGERSAIGRTLRIGGEPFELIGILDEKTGRQNINTNRPDNRLLIVAVSAAESRLGFDEHAVTRLSIYPRPGHTGETALRAVVRSLSGRTGFHPDDGDALRSFDLTSILGALDLMHVGFTLFIGFAGTVTLLVGGVGIANYHLATLAERELEIAVCRAIGARASTLALQSMVEATLVSGAAAGLGVAVGLAVCLGLVALAPAGMFPVPVLSPGAIGITAAALAGVGILAAVLPALRVRSIDVSTALRGAG
jgi:putative ABC transport system permease protein